eukprot:2387045-Pyramimonas_sp.AAC.1
MGFSGPYNMVHSAPRYVVVIPNRAVSLPSHRPQLAHYAVAGVAQGLPEGGGQGTTRTSKGALKTERLQSSYSCAIQPRKDTTKQSCVVLMTSCHTVKPMYVLPLLDGLRDTNR